MRTYPVNIQELEKKHNFSFPIDNKKLENIHTNVILRHDIAFVFLKLRIVNSLKERNLFVNDLSNISFLDKKFNTRDRLKIYNIIKNQVPQPKRISEKSILYSLVLLGVFVLPWIVFIMTNTKESILKIFSDTNPIYFIILFIIGVLLVAGFNYLFGDFFKSEIKPIDTTASTIREFICGFIKQNRIDIKEKFEIIFKHELDNLK